MIPGIRHRALEVYPFAVGILRRLAPFITVDKFGIRIGIRIGINFKINKKIHIF